MATTYLDHAASTPMHDEAVAALLPWLATSYANPTGAHRMAREGRQAIDEARDALASLFAMAPGGVVFTGSGTEADNLALTGISGRRTGLVACGAAEHHAVLHPVEQLGGVVVPTDRAGRIDLDALEAVLRRGPVSVVSVMAVNNETGVISDLAGVADLLAARSPGTALHCDAVQAMSWIDTASLGQWCDAISISAHKFGGPKGVGALLLGPQVTVNAQILGGGQEQERRSGTQNVAGIVAMAVAASVTAVRRVDTIARVACQRDRLVTGLQDRLDGVHVTVTEAPIAAGHAHVCIEGIESEAVLFLADRAGVAASAGSSCASGAVTLSHVLAAMGVEPERGRGALRFTLGHTTSAADVDHAVSVVTDAVTRLRSR